MVCTIILAIIISSSHTADGCKKFLSHRLALTHFGYYFSLLTSLLNFQYEYICPMQCKNTVKFRATNCICVCMLSNRDKVGHIRDNDKRLCQGERKCCWAVCECGMRLKGWKLNCSKNRNWHLKLGHTIYTAISPCYFYLCHKPSSLCQGLLKTFSCTYQSTKKWNYLSDQLTKLIFFYILLSYCRYHVKASMHVRIISVTSWLKLIGNLWSNWKPYLEFCKWIPRMNFKHTHTRRFFKNEIYIDTRWIKS